MFAGRCYLSSYPITRPAFYAQAFRAYKLDDMDINQLPNLDALDLGDDADRDPTRIGPLRFPWHVKYKGIRWTKSLAEAMQIFSNHVCFHFSSQVFTTNLL